MCVSSGLAQSGKSGNTFMDQIRQTPNSGYSGKGRITFQGKFSNNFSYCGVCLDRGWLGSKGTYVQRTDPDAHDPVWSRVGAIKGHQMLTFEVGAGQHELMIFNEFAAAEAITVTVPPGKTVRVTCGESFTGLEKLWYSVYYLFRPVIPGKYFYYLKQVAE